MNESKASIRIITSEDNPEVISEILNLAPTCVAKKGERVTNRDLNSPKRNRSIWILESPLASTATLEEHISHLCGLMMNAKTSVDLIKNKFDIFEVFCMFSSTSEQSSFKLSEGTLSMLALLKIDLVFDIYLLGASMIPEWGKMPVI